jgi:hypothetical protein
VPHQWKETVSSLIYELVLFWPCLWNYCQRDGVGSVLVIDSQTMTTRIVLIVVASDDDARCWSVLSAYLCR